MKKALIFGAAGFVGPYLATELRKSGYYVLGSDIIEKYTNKVYSEYLYCNILDASNVDSLIKHVSPDVIINLAAISSVKGSFENPQMTFEVNVIGSLNILESSKYMNGIKVLMVGSSEEYKVSNNKLTEDSPLDANNPYGISKVTAEMLARMYRDSYGIKVYYVRAFNHTGIGQSIKFVLPSFCYQVAKIQKSKQKGVITVGNIYVERDFSDVRDVVKGYCLVLEKGDVDKVYNIGSGISYKIKDLLDYIISLASVDIEIKEESALLRPSDIPYICCDNTSIVADTGWLPEFSIFETLQEMYQHFLNTSENI